MIRFINCQVWGTELREFWVKDGRFVLDGDADSPVQDLGGKWVMPGFVDAHCHILPGGLDLLKLNLSGCSTREEVLDAVRDWETGFSDDPDEWLLATQYDQTKFPGAGHLTRAELDSVSSTRPILLRHSNGHASVANSAALARAGVTRETADPEGGSYGRDSSGELDGVLLEKAHEFVTSQVPEPEFEQMVEAILRVGESMSGYGITAATDMMTGRFNLDKELRAYHEAARRGCKVRLRLSMQWATVLTERKGIDPGRLKELTSAMDPGQCGVIGLKVFADGAIGSATAAIYGKYATTGGNGQLIYSEENLKEIIRKIDAAGYGCAVHTIGDRSTDLVMEAYEATDDPSKHRIEHAMILSDAQIERMARLGAQVTMQPEFLKRFGHAYRAQIPDLAPKLKRFRSVLDAGIKLSFNSDRPIVPGNPWDGIEMAVKRPEGFDQAENITLAEAVHAYTEAGAMANFDPHQGAVMTGNRADFQVYECEPGVGSSPSEVWLGGENLSG